MGRHRCGLHAGAVPWQVKELDADKADREARGFAVELSIDPRFHIRLIGKQGVSVPIVGVESLVESSITRSLRRKIRPIFFVLMVFYPIERALLSCKVRHPYAHTCKYMR